MAVTEQIKSAIYRVYNSTSSIWNRYSFWNKASSCEFDDGETAEAKLGKIKGITTSLAATETGYAADATAVKTLNDIVYNKVPFSFGVDSDGNYGYKKSGADTVTPFKCYKLLTSSSISGSHTFNLTTLFPNNYSTLTTNNFLVTPVANISAGGRGKDYTGGDNQVHMLTVSTITNNVLSTNYYLEHYTSGSSIYYYGVYNVYYIS